MGQKLFKKQEAFGEAGRQVQLGPIYLSFLYNDTFKVSNAFGVLCDAVGWVGTPYVKATIPLHLAQVQIPQQALLLHPHFLSHHEIKGKNIQDSIKNIKSLLIELIKLKKCLNSNKLSLHLNKIKVTVVN